MIIKLLNFFVSYNKMYPFVVMCSLKMIVVIFE